MDHGGDEREFENPLYSDTGPPCYPNTTNQPVTEREYGELYSDCTMTGEALYTQNNVVQGTLTSAYANTLASGVIYGNSVPPTLEGIDEDTCTYSALGLTELNHPTPHDQSQTVLENEYSCLQHK